MAGEASMSDSDVDMSGTNAQTYAGVFGKCPIEVRRLSVFPQDSSMLT